MPNAGPNSVKHGPFGPLAEYKPLKISGLRWGMQL